MIKKFVQWFAKYSGSRNWDILWWVIKRLNRSDRIFLGLRNFREEVDYYTFKRDGLIWTTYGWDFTMTWSLLEHGHFQGEEIQAVISWIKENERMTSHRHYIVDVGANIGTTSIPFAREMGAHVLAIEPFPENFFLLKQNVHQNGLDQQVTCIQSAISDFDENVRMIMDDEGCGSAAVFDKEYAAQNNMRFVLEVPATGLMDLLISEEVTPEQVALVWSDTEGSEAKVVKTGGKLWEEGVPLFVEVYPRALEKQGGLSEFKNLVIQYFEYFITIKDLVRYGNNAGRRSVDQFPQLVDQLHQKSDLTDVLLLPGNFKD